MTSSVGLARSRRADAPRGCARGWDETRRLPGNLNLSFEGVDGERLVADLAGIAVSSGSACSSAMPGPSPVLLALGREPALAKASLRFGFGRGNTPEDVEVAVGSVCRAIEAQLENA